MNCYNFDSRFLQCSYSLDLVGVEFRDLVKLQLGVSGFFSGAVIRFYRLVIEVVEGIFFYVEMRLLKLNKMSYFLIFCFLKVRIRRIFFQYLDCMFFLGRKGCNCLLFIRRIRGQVVKVRGLRVLRNKDKSSKYSCCLFYVMYQFVSSVIVDRMYG